MALIVATMAMLLLTTVGAGLVLATITETTIAANFRNGIEARSAARAIVELGMANLAGAANWDSVLSGSERSIFVDGHPGGERLLSDGTRVDLSRVLDLARCGRIGGCTRAQMEARTAQRPWGPNNPRWQLYAYGYLHGLDGTGASPASPYVALLVGDDGLETDDDPERDGTGAGDPGSGVLALRAEAFGLRGARSTVDVIVSRSASAESLRVVSWREGG
jgi:hypothetical protein